MTPRVTLLSGGVGGAKLALGFYTLLDSERLTVVANGGDDLELFTLRICPDSDTLVYTLAGEAHPRQGWGLRGESFVALRRLQALGGESWFQLGDKDLGLHLYRSQALAQGVGLAEITARICAALQLRCTVLPMCEHYVPTRIDTEEGSMHLQEYLVRHRAKPVIRGIGHEGMAEAHPAPGIDEAFALSEMIVIAPSNPLISIKPILAVPGLSQALQKSRALKVAVSPIVGGRALKGPAAQMLAQLGHEVSSLGTARIYAGLVEVFVVDRQDAAQVPAIEALGFRCLIADTVMTRLRHKQRLARTLLGLLKRGYLR